MKIQKKIFFFFFFGGGGGGRVVVQDGCERRIEVFVKIPKTNKKNEGGGGVWFGGRVRVDVKKN